MFVILQRLVFMIRYQFFPARPPFVNTVYGQLFDPSIKESILGVDMGPLILGDPAYPFLDWLIKAYPENQNTPNWQQNFNYRLSRARMTAEDTLGRWKGRFRCVLKHIDIAVRCACYLVAAS